MEINVYYIKDKIKRKKIKDYIKGIEIDNKNNPFVSYFNKRISYGLNEIKKNLNIKKEDDISNINLPNEFSNFDEILINKSVDIFI